MDLPRGLPPPERRRRGVTTHYAFSAEMFVKFPEPVRGNFSEVAEACLTFQQMLDYMRVSTVVRLCHASLQSGSCSAPAVF